MMFAIFSDKYMPQFSDFWVLYSTIDKAVEALMKLPNDIIVQYKLEIYEIPVDPSNDQRKKRLDANDPRITQAAKQMADRRRHGS